MTAASEWSTLADPGKAIRTTGICEEHFEDWYAPAQTRAAQAVAAGFKPLAEQFTAGRRSGLRAESQAQQEWLKKRADEITGPVVADQARQGELFGSESGEAATGTPAAEWASISDPAERLGAFASDRSQRPAQRSEADGVLRIFQQRSRTLERLMDLRSPEVIPLGVLMLIPEVDRGA